MDDREVPPEQRERSERYLEEVIKAFERELDAARDLSRRHADTIRKSQRRDEPVLIERRRKPR
jgi:hypothetical protein